MNEAIQIGIFDFIIFIGVIQGLLLAFFLIKKSGNANRTNLLHGLLFLFLSLTILEELLNNTGFIVQLLPISDFSEPLNFTFGPLFYLYVKQLTKSNHKNRLWPQFIPAIFWLVYMTFYFIQPNELKYNSYVETKHPDWDHLMVNMIYSDDPLGIRNYINELTLIHFIVYIGLSVVIFMKKLKALKESIFFISNKQLRMLRNTLIHFLMIVTIFMATKLYFGMDSDIGGYFIASYISLMFFVTTYQVMNKSDYFIQPQLLPELPLIKYRRSSLNESDKARIQKKLNQALETDLYFKDNLASLAGLAQSIHENRHHVSQVINEKYQKNFFELIAYYRIKEASHIIIKDSTKKITIEELADLVGYNSKSSFNSAFKRETGHTPSEFRQLNKKKLNN